MSEVSQGTAQKPGRRSRVLRVLGWIGASILALLIVLVLGVSW